MKEKYKQSVKAINEAASFFALRAYQAETTFHSQHNSMSATIYFYNIDERKLIEDDLRRYADEDDVILFREYNKGEKSQFYTLTLYKNPPRILLKDI